MTKKIYLLILLCCVFLASGAQKGSARRYSFHSINNLGLINGSNGTSAAIQTVNGFKRGNWFGGIGVGLDYYQYRSVPLFADLRYELGGARNRYFAYADAGINLSWVEESVRNDRIGWISLPPSDFDNGFYTDMGLGVSIGLKHNNAILLSLGFSRKTLDEEVKTQDWRTMEWVTEVNAYRLNRIVIKLGFRF